MIMIRWNGSTIFGRPMASWRGCGAGVVGLLGESGRHCIRIAAVRLGLGEVAVQGEQLEPSGEVGGDRGDLDLGGVDRHSRDGLCPIWFLGCLGSVLDPGVGTVPGLQEPSCPMRVLVAKAWYRWPSAASNSGS
jgi:hypothetical protein